MIKKILLLLLVSSQFAIAQTGINTDDPKVNLHVKPDLSDPNAVEGIITPQLSGNQLKNKDNLYTTEQKGAIVYVTSAASPTSNKTALVTKKGYFYFDGNIWRAFEEHNETVQDVTRFLGGTVYVTFSSMDNDGSSFNRVIAAESNGKYAVGTIQETPKRGGIDIIRGNGYTISNPADGIFDIKFDVPYIEIYGISVDILDAYGQYNQGTVGIGQMPELDVPGKALYTNDNAQVSFISDQIIRIKTGDDPGDKENRSFTFLVTGR